MSEEKPGDSNKHANVNRQEVDGSISSTLSDALTGIDIGYEIRIKDHLDTYWYEWFEGWSITNLDCSELSLRRYNVDQAALHGALNKIRDLNLTLLSVTRISMKSGSA